MKNVIDRFKYAVSEISKNYNNKTWVYNRANHHINGKFQRRYKPISESTFVTEEEWSTLVIADAMSKDLYFNHLADKYNSIFDEREIVTSPGSSTPTWLKNTFTDYYGDIVYVAGNPQVSRHKRDSFYELYEVWKHSFNKETSVIDPKLVTDRAIKARDEHPNKKVIVHYMQPHIPFIGYSDLNYSSFDFEDIGMEETSGNQSIKGVWDALSKGLVDVDDVWEGYVSNGEIVLEEIKRLLENTDDHAIVTSDHGNMFGTRSWPIPLPVYGHPGNLRNEDLVEVPWLVRNGKKREVVSEEIKSSKDLDEEELQERLSALGYRK